MSGNRVTVTVGEAQSPSAHAFETVERKGIGHPDTMADLVAETFCYRYAQHCHAEFGSVPNHSADKVTLAGADAVVRLGGYDIVEPIGAYYFGKVSRHVGGRQIPVEDLFHAAVSDVLAFCTRDNDILRFVRSHVKAVTGSPLDHHAGYYGPESTDQLRSIATTERVANDTVACAASSRRTLTERLVIDLERYLQSSEFRLDVPDTGSDIKVLAARHGRLLDITTCVPFHPSPIKSWQGYEDRLRAARNAIDSFIGEQDTEGLDEVVVNVNKRDVPGRGYLAPFGTALGKGDVGAVGRGNRYSGLITPNRAMSVEAPAGKNLMHHAGKIYSVLAQWISDVVSDRLDVDNEVIITSRIGAPLNAPGNVAVRLAVPASGANGIAGIVAEQMDRVDEVVATLFKTDPLDQMSDHYASAAR